MALENRARYYDQAGALTDMIQSHLLQILALIAMEPPANINAVDLRDRQGNGAAGLPDLERRSAHRGQAGPLHRRRRSRRQVPDYADEPGVDPARNTETLAELTVQIDNWRWAGVPFRLRSGKALSDCARRSLVTFKPIPHLPTGLTATTQPDQLRLTLSPDRMAIEMNVNSPGDPFTLERAALTHELSPGRLAALR